MTVEQPTSVNNLGTPSHSNLHRVVGADLGATDESLAVHADDSTRMSAMWMLNANAVTDANYTILDGDGYSDIDVSTGVSDRTITLPTLAANQGRVIFITKTDSGAGDVIVDGEGAEIFLDGSTTITMTTQGDTLAVKGSALGWKVF